LLLLLASCFHLLASPFLLASGFWLVFQSGFWLVFQSGFWLNLGGPMCRNIRTLFNFDPPATDEEVRDASLQFVRKLSGFTNPSKANQEAFDRAVEGVAEVARELLGSLVTTAEPKDRETEAARARARSAARFG
jgi:hypothetical protein